MLKVLESCAILARAILRRRTFVQDQCLLELICGSEILTLSAPMLQLYHYSMKIPEKYSGLQHVQNFGQKITGIPDLQFFLSFPSEKSRLSRSKRNILSSNRQVLVLVLDTVPTSTTTSKLIFYRILVIDNIRN